MRYYSDITKKFYTDEDTCRKAEQIALSREKAKQIEREKFEGQRKDAMKEIEKAYDEYHKAKKHYKDLVYKFTEKYGAYYNQISTINDEKKTLLDLFLPF